MSLTCITCSVKFHDADIQREHYKTDWHRYNLKRKVAELPPVTAEEFRKRVIDQKTAELDASKETSYYCNACHKQFNSQKAHENHLNSKKHKENLDAFVKQNVDGKDVTIKRVTSVDESKPVNAMDEVIEEVDSDEWEELNENPITENNCIFCEHHSEDMTENLEHMSKAHSFFVPDIEFCTDFEGLLFYLGEKVTSDFICLWCNDRGKTFFTLDAVRKHMIDKGHCKMLHEGLALAEYAEFYDYSKSYPDHDDGMDIDEELKPEVLEGDEYQLVLPSGFVIGHRSLMRYYKQRLNPNRAVVPAKSNRKLHKVLAQYRALGWNSTQQEAAARKARDIHFMKRVQSKWAMKLGTKANKLQSHFRPQVNF